MIYYEQNEETFVTLRLDKLKFSGKILTDQSVKTMKSTREKILDAALALLKSKGYHAITMDEIASGAGVSKGTLYWHFTSKKDLFLQLVSHWVRHFSEEMANEISKVSGPLEKLKKLFAAFTRQFVDHSQVFEQETEFWSLAHRDADFRSKVQKVYGSFLKLIQDVIEKGKQDGEFNCSSTKFAALATLMNLESCIWFTLFAPDGLNYQEYLDFFAKNLLFPYLGERRDI
ncbi:MAG: TetR/AcrR family transcriptional regulator [Candidatus Aminicenantia bacterium]